MSASEAPITRARPETCLSDLVLDRLLASELSGSPEEAARAHLATCPLCSARRRTLEEDRGRFSERFFVPALARDAKRRALRPMWLTGFAAAAAAAIAATLAITLPDESIVPGVRRKGGFALEVVARRAGGRIEPVFPGGKLAAGDAIRFKVSADEPGVLLIAALDSTPSVTLYYPRPGETIALELGEQWIDGSITLDDTLGPERIVALSCPDEVTADRAVDAAREALVRAGGDPSRVEHLELGCRQTTFLFEKVSP